MSMATECRQLRWLMSDAHARHQMMFLARCFERLARLREDMREGMPVPEHADD